jgi:predicted ATPase/DNA-binding SARP family transcriptional activator
VQWLLALLALRHGREVERSWLAGLLWPDSSEGAAFASLRNSLKDLRRALGAEAGRLKSPTPRTLSLDLEGAYADIIAFDAAIDRGDRSALEQAVELYGGPLMEGWAEEWAFEERQRREQVYLIALETLAAEARRKGDLGAAERHLRRAVTTDPLRETAQRALMQVLADAGSYAAALTTYRELRLRLHRDLSAEPDPETQALFQQIRSEARARAVDSSHRGLPPHPPDDLAPRSSPELFPNNLPLQLTRFIGREQAMSEVRQLIRDHRLVTLTGAGGCGKTRLALEVAADLLESFPDGVWFVELAPLSDPTLVPHAVAAVLGLQEMPGRPLAQTLADRFVGRQLLLLDNCEHLIEASAELIHEMLQGCPRLQVLTTSREPLGVTGEHRYRVPPLSVPDAKRLPAGGDLMQYEAVQFLMERVAAVQPAFELTEENAPAVVQVCRRLDGLPLAIELAAARAAVLTVEQIAGRLDDRFRLLTGGSRTVLPRQQTLRAAMDWSCDLLTEAERTLLRRLCVFSGGWSLEAVEAVASGSGIEEWEVLDLLTALVEKSLVQFDWRAGEARYRLLETVRQYAWDRLVEAREEAGVHEQHRDWFLALAERAAPELHRSDQRVWIERLATEYDNLRAALAWSLAQDAGVRSETAPRAGERSDVDGAPPSKGEVALRLGVALWGFWWVRGHWAEGRHWLEGALARGADAPAGLRAKALAAAAHLAGFTGDQTARGALAEESLRLARAVEDPWLTSWMLFLQGGVARERDDLSRAAALGEQSLALARGVDDPWLTADPLLLLGMVAWEEGDYTRAALLLTESLSLLQQIGDRTGMTIRLLNLGVVALLQGQLEEAAARCKQGIALSQDLGDTRGILWCLFGLAAVTAARGEATRAARIIGTVDTTLTAIGHAMPPRMRAMYDRTIARVRAAVGETAFTAAWEQGRATPLQQAITCASQEDD